MPRTTEMYRSTARSPNRTALQAPVDLTSDDNSADSTSLASASEKDLHVGVLAAGLTSLSLRRDQCHDHLSTPQQKGLKRRARNDEDCNHDGPSSDRKRHRQESEIYQYGIPKLQLTRDKFERRTSSATIQSERGSFLEDAIDLLPDEDVDERAFIVIPDDSDVIDDPDDLVSDDDEPLCTGVRRILKLVKKKVRQVLEPNKQSVNHVKINGIDIEQGCCVEFNDGTFMEVHTIYLDTRYRYVLVGSVFTRITERELLMPNQRDSLEEWRWSTVEMCKFPRYFKGKMLINEVCQRIKIATGEAEQDKGLWRRPATEIKQKHTLIKTNQIYRDDCVEASHTADTITEAEGVLTCRWKETIVMDEFGKVREVTIRRPSQVEVSTGRFINEDQHRMSWQGSTPNLALPNAKPSFADACCGAGGMSLGAQAAGFEIRAAFDIDKKKIATHQLNFPRCKSKRMGVYEWIQWAGKQHIRVDLLHLSPPCQPFSPANTTPDLNKNETNQAVFLGCGQVIERLRPRIVTIEESDGLLNRHSKWFGALIEQLTNLDYSIRWACLKCSDYGVPQLRRRFFLIAAAPGEDLPFFPEPTHTPGTVSVQRTLDDLEARHTASPLPYHNPESLRLRAPRAPYNSFSLAKTITCKGGENYHPSGQRGFTVSEFAALQTFPYDFIFPEKIGDKAFSRTEMKIQVGNAVPPLVAGSIAGAILRSLKASDEGRLRRIGGASETDAIEVDD